MSLNQFTQSQLPCFQAINIEAIPQDTKALLDENRQKMKELLENNKHYTWENLIHPLEELNDKLQKFWSPISHLHGVLESEALRKAYNETLPLLTDYHTEIVQNEKLFQAIKFLAEDPSFNKLNPAQQKIIENDLRDFKLAGIHLGKEDKDKLANLSKRLSKLMTVFSENLLDATAAFTLHITDEKKLSGLPEQALSLAKKYAAERNLSGHVFTLDYPSYSTALKYLPNRELRKQLYEAYVTRASEVGPNARKWDNTPIMEEILQVRHEIAQLVGFGNYADYSLATKMAKSPDEVMTFLHDLVEKSKPMAEAEYKEIKEFAAACDGIDQLEAWDVGYYSEKLCESKFQFSQEDVRPYFPIDKALSGLFNIVEKIYGLTISEQKDIEVWHPDVKFFAVYDDKKELRGGFYIDLYARAHKRDGAWMDECRTRKILADGTIQHPVAYLTCNFMPPVDQHQALLTHDDVLTLFHEFGHCLHHMLTQVNYPSVAGINGVPWDAVEFPSQFMENFCWEKAALALLAQHHQTNESLPDDLYKKMLDAKHFQTGLQMIRQIEFSLFDFLLHLNYQANVSGQVMDTLNEVRKETSVIHPPAFNRFPNSFAHVFAGSYAAGYYSYKWAEVLSSDAYAKFEENGVFDAATGKSFMQNILEVGGVPDPMDAFVAFRGRPPKIDALLRQTGITEEAASDQPL